MPFDPNDPDTKAALDAAIAKATDPLKDSIGKLETKRDELIADLRKARQLGEIKPEDLAAAEDRADKAEKALGEVQKQVKTLTTERDNAVKALETESKFSTEMLTENALNEALASAGVTVPGLLAGAKSMFGRQAQVVDDNGKRIVKLGDKAVADAIKEWAATDDAKHYITAAVNSGGGASGGKGAGGDGKTMTRAQFDGLTQPERAKFALDGGKVISEAA